jgi:anti-anti-sigma factor
LAESCACQLAITMTYAGTSATIALIGELDIAVVADVREIVKLVVANEGLTAVNLDASRVTFIDSTGLMILMRARQTAEDNLLTFTLATTHSGPVEQVIGLCGLGRSFADCRA